MLIFKKKCSPTTNSLTCWHKCKLDGAFQRCGCGSAKKQMNESVILNSWVWEIWMLAPVPFVYPMQYFKFRLTQKDSLRCLWSSAAICWYLVESGWCFVVQRIYQGLVWGRKKKLSPRNKPGAHQYLHCKLVMICLNTHMTELVLYRNVSEPNARCHLYWLHGVL